ncbi:uncharacterized protein BJX67DRAFT_377637 [Aspergillus lucknowensis]|uniref:Uncharacterized protein n=1 Tax=Aspergillus lucknowensis TaxID=176173 RepID=A0ABR4M360_9EURO
MDQNPTGQGPSRPTPPPVSSLRLYRRLFKGRKQLFSESDTAPASYFLTNRIPHKHSLQWRPLFYRGDNPKYTPEATIIGRARRTAMWGTFRVWMGDGVQEVVENERRRRERRKAERKNKWRKRFGKEPKAIEVEEEKEVRGKVVLVRMQRMGFLSRRVEFEVEGVRYRWSGTRMFATGSMAGVKGWSHCMKLIRISDHALIATFERRLLVLPRSIKTGGPPNKSKSFLGTLTVYDRSNPVGTHGGNGRYDLVTNLMAHVDAANTKPSDLKDEENLNPDGTHAGNLTDDAIAFTCWIVVEAEHRLRHKAPDFLEEVAENAQG